MLNHQRVQNLVVEDITNFVKFIESGFDVIKFALLYLAFLRHTVIKKKNQAMLSNRRNYMETLVKIINHRRNVIENTSVENELRHDMLTSLITANTEPIAGGVDTTANLLCFVIYYLCHYPDVLARLQKELDSIDL
ncbi:19070_t:CDS:2 [Funneliformis geosporum]|uniref:19070_t:CDS:1 n=1 Tax=Funneliformis geosporum TaxID=1117311 RepID=A0A9W4SHY3_9GLOM|nr:19070_t:CDS:2 [Funneliformis geosporum]